jgi:hypothetical protein
MSTTTVDWKQVREELRARRNKLFDQFLKNPGKIGLAIEIKALDDEMVECAEHQRREQRIQK